jgi:hypothetical protein
MKLIAASLAAMAMLPVEASCSRAESGTATATVTIPFSPPLDRPIRYTVTNQPADSGRDISFTLRFTAREGGYRMIINEPGGPEGLPPIVVLVTHEGRMTDIENREALIGFFVARWERQYASVPSDQRVRTIRVLRTLLEMTLSGDAMAGVYAPALELAGATLDRTPRQWPMMFYEEYGGLRLPWRVTLEAVEGDIVIVSAEAEFSRGQAIAHFSQIAGLFSQEGGAAVLERMGWQPPAGMNHFAERGRATYRVSRRDGLTEQMDLELVTERRNRGDAQVAREVRHVTVRRLL